jgi:hypothetical protein
MSSIDYNQLNLKAMKKLILALVIGGSLVFNLAFSNGLDSTEFKDKSAKIERIKYSIDSLIKAELGNVELTESFNPECHGYAIKKIKGESFLNDDSKVHFRSVNSVPNDVVSIYDLPLSHLISRVKENITNEEIQIKDFEFTKYSIVFGDVEGRSYMAISIDY